MGFAFATDSLDAAPFQCHKGGFPALDEAETMSHAQVFRISAAVMMLFGLTLLLMPNVLLAMYGGQPMNGPGIYNSMLYGGVLVAMAVMNWMAASLLLAETRAIVLGNLVANCLGFLVAIFRQLTDATVPPTAWLNVAIFLVFVVMFAQLQRRMKAAAQALPGVAPAS
jgi:hypothetical protein